MFRPKIVITGAIVHGWCRRIYITDEELHKGVSTFIELLSLTIQAVYEQSQRLEVSFPNHLITLAANTVAQAKNRETCVVLSYLVGEYQFRTTNC